MRASGDTVQEEKVEERSGELRQHRHVHISRAHTTLRNHRLGPLSRPRAAGSSEKTAEP